VLLLLVVAGLGAARLWAPATEPILATQDEVVEVDGDVPQPGRYTLEGPLRVHAALRAAGVEELADIPDAGLDPGTRIVLTGTSYRLESMERPLVVGLPIELNQASESTLESIPGVGQTTAAAIVLEREQGGLFSSVDDLQRVKGIGPKTVEDLRPFVTVESGASQLAK